MRTTAEPSNRNVIRSFAWALVASALGLASVHVAFAAETPYLIQPGDVLQVSVWKEADLQIEALVRPDGGLSFPLVGELQAENHTIEDIRTSIVERLGKFIPTPVVTVALKQLGGNRVYVIGKVNKPGDFVYSKSLDVMQALALAGGATSFAAVNDIQILRRNGPNQTAIPFRYSDVERGRALDQNVLLHSGDVVVVP